MGQWIRWFFFSLIHILVALDSNLVCALPKKETLGQGLIFREVIRGEETDSSFALIIEGHRHLDQKMTLWGIRQYGFVQSRLEIGSPFGLTVDSVSGIILYGLDQRMEGGWPFLGFEPLSGEISWDSGSLSQHFYEWFPMMSTGLQFSFGHCSFFSLVKGGVSIGNLNQNDFSPQGNMSYGMGTHLNCEGLNFGAVLTRVHFPGSSDFLKGTLDLAVEDRGLPFYFGIRGELLGALDPLQVFAMRLEKRAMLIVRSSFE